jgi:hypothetical protein
MPVFASPLTSLCTAESIVSRAFSSSANESGLPLDASSAYLAVCCDSTWICVVNAVAWRSSPFFELSTKKSTPAKMMNATNAITGTM